MFCVALDLNGDTKKRDHLRGEARPFIARILEEDTVISLQFCKKKTCSFPLFGLFSCVSSPPVDPAYLAKKKKTIEKARDVSFTGEQPPFVLKLVRKGKRDDDDDDDGDDDVSRKPKKSKEKVASQPKSSSKKRTKDDDNGDGDDGDDDDVHRTRLRASVTVEQLCGVLLKAASRLHKHKTLSETDIKHIQEMLSNFGKGDIAYWVRKLDPMEVIAPGQVVALVIVPGSRDGLRVTLAPSKDAKVFGWTVVARALQGPQPVVVGNPSRISSDEGVLVVYMGHARVRCEPNIKAGDTLHGGGKQVGLATSSGSKAPHRMGVALGDYDASDGMAVAMVWIMRDNHGDSVHLASLDENVKELQVRVSQHIAVQVTREEFNTISSRFKVLECRVDHMDERLGKVEHALRVPTKDDLDNKYEQLLEAFAADFVRTRCDEMRLKLFCQPDVNLSMDQAIYDEDSNVTSILHDLGSGTLCDGLEQRKWMVLQGEAGVGKTVQLQSLCYTYGHHRARIRVSLSDRSLWLYVDLADLAVGKTIVSASHSLLEVILVHCFAVPSDSSPIDCQSA